MGECTVWKWIKNRKRGILLWHDCGFLLSHQILYGRNCSSCLNTNNRLKVSVFEDTGQDSASIQMAPLSSFSKVCRHDYFMHSSRRLSSVLIHLNSLTSQDLKVNTPIHQCISQRSSSPDIRHKNCYYLYLTQHKLNLTRCVASPSLRNSETYQCATCG